jgi:hypothetical protein
MTLFLSGCSLFFGNIKPIEEKANDYGVLDLSKVSSDWVKLDPKSNSEAKDSTGIPESGVSDVAFQSKKTASIISVNSACKVYQTHEKVDLAALTRELLLGISSITAKEERKLTIDHFPALETTVQGKINEENMMLRTVVLHRVNCTYDLMYVARPEKFNVKVEDFSRFVSSLKLK